MRALQRGGVAQKSSRWVLLLSHTHRQRRGSVSADATRLRAAPRGPHAVAATAAHRLRALLLLLWPRRRCFWLGFCSSHSVHHAALLAAATALLAGWALVHGLRRVAHLHVSSGPALLFSNRCPFEPGFVSRSPCKLGKLFPRSRPLCCRVSKCTQPLAESASERGGAAGTMSQAASCCTHVPDHVSSSAGLTRIYDLRTALVDARA